MSDGNTLIVLDTASAEKFILTVCFVWLVVVSGGSRKTGGGGPRWSLVVSGGSRKSGVGGSWWSLVASGGLWWSALAKQSWHKSHLDVYQDGLESCLTFAGICGLLASFGRPIRPSGSPVDSKLIAKGEVRTGEQNLRGGAPCWCVMSRVCRVKRGQNDLWDDAGESQKNAFKGVSKNNRWGKAVVERELGLGR